MEWTHKGKHFKLEDYPEEITYFVYLISYSDGSKYVGSKVVRSKRRLKPLKSQLEIRKNYKREEIKESNWKKYEGSTKFSKGKSIKCKEILHLCLTKRAATMLEVKEILCRDAIVRDDYLNENALGKFYRNSYEEIYKG